MKKAMLPGSYDPVTLGHVDIIRRASMIFDEVHAVVMINAEKRDTGLFLPEERLEILKNALRDVKGVKCTLCESLASDYAVENEIKYLVKGVRNGTDFDYEYSLSQIMKKFESSLETVLLPADPALGYLSSTYARERIRYGCDLSDVADEGTGKLIREIYSRRK